jgi:hypothetical protein
VGRAVEEEGTEDMRRSEEGTSGGGGYAVKGRAKGRCGEACDEILRREQKEKESTNFALCV